MKIEMMNRLEEFRRKGLEENRMRMDRMMAAQQASMQVLKQQQQAASVQQQNAMQPQKQLGLKPQRNTPLLSNPG